MLLKMMFGPIKFKVKEVAELLGLNYPRALALLRDYRHISEPADSLEAEAIVRSIKPVDARPWHGGSGSAEHVLDSTNKSSSSSSDELRNLLKSRVERERA